MLFPILAIIAGIAILVFGSDRFVAAAASLAKQFGLPPLLIGIIVIGFGTSLPEMLVSATGAIKGTPGIALGNAYGSNIANILLILGVCALISTLRVTPDAVRREMPLLLASTGLTLLLVYHRQSISRLDAFILILFFAVCMYITVKDSLSPKKMQDPEEQHIAKEIEDDIKPMPVKTAVLWVVAGLALMLISSDMLVWGAVSVARHFGVSDLIIGLTIVAVGTSLPELASSIAATRRGEDDLALGNIIGSNNFNTLVVVGLAGLIRPLPAEPALLSRDLPVMTGVTVLLYLFCRFKPSAGRLTRPEGAVLFVLYVAYTLYLICTAAGGAAVPEAV